jgi:two-component system response regulator GlrR
MLAEQGHTISTVATAEDALTWLARQQPDVVLVDIGLPGMQGDALFDAIAQRWPRLAQRTIVTSGLLHAPRKREAYLQKPFTRAQLLRVIERLPSV